MLAIAFVAGLLAWPGSTMADGSWLDAEAIEGWNLPSAAIPIAPGLPSGTDPRCVATARPPETDEDRALAAQGWMLIAEFQGGWGVRNILGASSFDGMCRPLGYQHFIFVDGQFAGTDAPAPMDSRTDGAATSVRLSGPDQLNVTYQRYAPTDPLCCPSRQTYVTWQIDRSQGAPVLVPASSFTTPGGS